MHEPKKFAVEIQRVNGDWMRWGGGTFDVEQAANLQRDEIMKDGVTARVVPVEAGS